MPRWSIWAYVIQTSLWPLLLPFAAAPATFFWLFLLVCSKLLPQDLCIYCFFCLEGSWPKSPQGRKDILYPYLLWDVTTMRPSQTLPFKISHPLPLHAFFSIAFNTIWYTVYSLNIYLLSSPLANMECSWCRDFFGLYWSQLYPMHLKHDP